MRRLQNAVFSVLAVGLVLWPALTGATALVQSWRNLASAPASSASHPLLDIELNRHDSDVTPRPFDEPLISVTFDDGWQSIYLEALPLMERYGINSTQFIVSGVVGAPDYMSRAQLMMMLDGRHEIGSHTLTHADLTTLNYEDLKQEVERSAADLSELIERRQPIDHFASPLNAYNDTTVAAVSGVYRSHRTTDWPYVNTAANFDRYRILALTVENTTALEDIAALIEQAKAVNGWLVLVYHQVDTGGGQYSTTPADFERHLQLIKSSGVTVSTLGDVLEAM